MAKANLSKRGKGKGFTWDSGSGGHSISQAAHDRNAPFRVLDSPYKTQGDFNKAVETTAQGTIQPQLNEWERNRGVQTQQHTGRTGDITSMYNAGSEARQAAIDRTSGALNNLVTLNSGVSGATRDAMAAALRGGHDTEAAVAGQLGVAPLPDKGQAYQDATQAQIDKAGIGMTGDFAGILGGLAQGVGNNEVGRAEAGRTEQSRWDAIMQQLTGDRRAITDQLGPARETARQNLSATELARSGQAEQQRLGRAQQTLNENQFGEQKIQNKSQRSIAGAQQREAERANRVTETAASRAQTETERANLVNEGINQQQADNQAQQLRNDAAKAGDTNTAAVLKAKADRFDAGVKLLSDFFKPDKLETGKKNIKKSYEQRVTNGYGAMVSQLMSSTGAGEVEVRQMILAAVNSGTPWGKRWTSRAQQEIRSIKNARLYQGKNARPT